MNTKDNKKLDRTTIIACGIMALMASIGILFLAILVFGITPDETNKVSLITAQYIMTSGIWGGLLFKNC